MPRKRNANHLKAWRERAGYTQQEIAEYLGIDRGTLAYYEVGKTQPNAQTMVLLCFLYHVPAEQMLRSIAGTSLMDCFARVQAVERKKL